MPENARPTRLSALDVTFLHVEDSVSHMNIGSIGVFEGPPPEPAQLLALIASKLPAAPRYRQKLRFVPLQAGRPVWVDDPDFDLGYHVRRTALPAPGADEQLRALVGRVMSHQLDRKRPLWEMWVVEGLAEGRWALLSKLHHAMVDGVSATNLLTGIMDRTPDFEPPPAIAPWAPQTAPSTAALVTDALTERVRGSVRDAGSLVRSVRRPRALAGDAGRTLQGLLAYAGAVRPPRGTALNGAIGPHRRWDHAEISFADVQEIRRALGGTVNDVVLAVIAGGFRDLIVARGQTPPPAVRSMVPVSVRARGQEDVHDNRVSTMFADLPVSIEDPVERLHAVTEHMRHLKATHEAEAGEVLTSVVGFAPETLLALGGRVATRVPQNSVNTVTTNVPGPQHTLYLAGRRLIESFPYVPLAGHVRIGVAIYSYDGGLYFGVTGDYDRAPDIGVLCAGIERAMAELVEAARAAAGTGAPPADAAQVARR